MKTGKISSRLLSNLLDKIPNDPSVLIGAKVGMDGAVLNTDLDLMVAVNDPITFETDNMGYYSVAVNANDIAVMGGEPKYFLATILMPPGATEAEIRGVFDNLLSACNDLDITLIGGHTEITSAVTRPVISGTMLGKSISIPKPESVSEGDILLQVNPVAIEGTAILAGAGKEALKKAGVSEDIIQKGYSHFTNMGICVSSPARIALSASNEGVLLMHDPTEGGISTAICEMALATGKQMAVSKEKILVLPECRTFCEALDLNCLGLISSGTLLAVVKKDKCDSVKKTLIDSNYEVSEIGYVSDMDISESDQAFFVDSKEDYPYFERDEIARFFDE